MAKKLSPKGCFEKVFWEAAWIRSHHLCLLWNFKLFAGNFAWELGDVNNLVVFKCLLTTPSKVNFLAKHFHWWWWDWTQTTFLNLFYFKGRVPTVPICSTRPDSRDSSAAASQFFFSWSFDVKTEGQLYRALFCSVSL